MSLKRVTVAAAAVLGLSIGAYSASADPLTNAAAPATAKSPSTFTLIARGGGHAGGGMRGGGGMHMGGMRGGGMRMGGAHFGGGHGAFRGGRGYGGRTAFYHGGRGYWRGGRWFPFVGVGVYGGSCYWNCRAQGFGPGYCHAYSFNFCY